MGIVVAPPCRVAACGNGRAYPALMQELQCDGICATVHSIQRGCKALATHRLQLQPDLTLHFSSPAAVKYLRHVSVKMFANCNLIKNIYRHTFICKYLYFCLMCNPHKTCAQNIAGLT